jgi:O-antigen/teichoic acid export membrane protein
VNPSPDARTSARALVSGSALQAFGSTCSLGLQAVHFALLARLYSVREFAAAVTALAIYGIVGALAEFGLQQTAVLQLGSGRTEQDVLRATRRVSLGLCSVAATIGAGLLLVLPEGVGRSAASLLPAFVVLRLQVTHAAARQHRVELVRLAVSDLANRSVAALVVGAAWVGDLRSGPASDLVLGASLLAGALCTYAGRRTRWRGERTAGGGLERSIFRDALPLGLTQAASFVHVRIDQVVLAAFGLTTGLAAYAVAYRVLDASLALVAAIGVVTFPLLVRSPPHTRAATARQIGDLLALIAVGGAAVAFALAPLLGRLLGGADYPESGTYIRWLTPVLLVSALNMVPAQIVIVDRGSRSLLKIAVGGVVANLSLNVLLVPALDVGGAVLSTLTTEALGLVLVCRLAHRRVPGAVDVRVVALLPPLFAITAFAGHALLAQRRGALAAAIIVAGGAGVAFLVVPGARRLISSLRQGALQPDG